MPKRRQIPVTIDEIERRIYVVRGQRVMVDDELAEMYGVPTKVLNQAVRRNSIRFPADFAFRLTWQEFTNLKSQSVTSSYNYGGRRKRPWVFTEHGVAMLSSVLRSPMAVKVNIEIMRAFVRLRRLLVTPGEIVAQLVELTRTVQMHDGDIQTIYEVLKKLMEPPIEDPERAKRRIGFERQSVSRETGAARALRR